MMKRIFIFALLASISMVSAGRNFRTPFEKTERYESGKRIYKFENPNFSRSSLSLGYGFMPVESFGWYSGSVFNSAERHSQVVNSLNSKTNMNLGAISLAYANQLTPWLELQIPLIYTYSQGSFSNPTATMNSQSYFEYFFSMTPNVKISWLFSDKFRFYSRVGFGFSIGNRYERYQAGLNSKFSLSWQLSPVGIEVGKQIRFFAEAGFGSMGIIQAGVKLHFLSESNNSDGSPKVKSTERYNWYEHRLR